MKILKYRIKKVENMSLTKQLVCVTLVALVLASFILGIILPAFLRPYYENNVYSYLSQPSKFIRPETDKMGDDIAFIIITKSGAIYTSDNLNEMVSNLSATDIISKANKEKGKFISKGNIYYYLWGEKNGTRNLIITDNRQIKSEAKELIGIILPTMIATVATTIILLFTWSQYVLSKIKKLQDKTRSIITGKQVEGREFVIDDELNELNTTIEEVNKELKQKEEYKNMMFQNLSHELKTPISVIQSYIEGVQDGVVDKDDAIRIIAEENETLYRQVNTTLQINKIDYMKDSKKYTNSKVNIINIANNAVEKHKQIKSDLNFNIIVDDNKEKILFMGTEDMWKAVFDNILGNFLRFAKKNINIVLENDKIIFENDGEKIEQEMLTKIFLPYVKGKKGQSGLGLSIVKKTVNIFGYDIEAENIDTGVRFVIY